MAAKARVIEIERSTFVGTPQQLRDTVLLLRGAGADAAVVEIKACNFVVLDKPLTQGQVRAALKITPQ